MKAAVYDTNGPPSVLRYADMPDPTVGARDVLIQVDAISVEGGDVFQRRLVPPPRSPYVVGYQAAGTVIDRGEDVRSISLGQRVAAFNWSGSHASLFVAPETLVYPVPLDLSLEIASTIPVTFGTADDALFEFGRLCPGETVLVIGAAGGVGVAALQLANQAGATVFGVASGEERLERLEAFGMDAGIDYATTEIRQEALRLTEGRGVDLVVDLAGGPQVHSHLKALRRRGRYVVVGVASGEEARFGAFDILPRSLTVAGVMFGDEMQSPRAHEIIARHMASAAAGEIQMPIAKTYPLAEAAAAHLHAETGHPVGRVLLKPSPCGSVTG
jgi:NADPH:quinone reductase-like Zn-dependent oxidoreductase